MQKLMKRLAYIAKKNGIAAPRWIYVCSDYDAAKGVHVRRHVHLIISREGFTYSKGCWFFCGREFSNIWNNGVAIRRQMSEGPDYTYLAAYLVNQARSDKADVKSYHSSKNLYRPKPSLEVINASELLRIPLNAVVLDSYSTYLGYEYVKFFVPNKKNADDS
ncbi:MAG: hypothetical protein II897_05865 [Clostridia bacterium]|nr:hypothetical protein [Clostridia bacterium]